MPYSFRGEYFERYDTNRINRVEVDTEEGEDVKPWGTKENQL